MSVCIASMLASLFTGRAREDEKLKMDAKTIRKIDPTATIFASNF